VLFEFHRVLKAGGIVGFCEPGPSHSKSSEAQHEMKLNRVIESDIILDDIYNSALNVGFTGMRQCISTLSPMILDFQKARQFRNDEASQHDYINATEWRRVNYPIFFLYKADEQRITNSTRITDKLSGELFFNNTTEKSINIRDLNEIVITAHNSGSATWLPSGSSLGSVNIGIITTDSIGNSIEYRSHLSSNPLLPSDSQTSVIDLCAYRNKNIVTIKIDLVSENVVWFESLGLHALTINVE
jgi:hypothetical protein